MRETSKQRKRVKTDVLKGSINTAICFSSSSLFSAQLLSFFVRHVCFWLQRASLDAMQPMHSFILLLYLMFSVPSSFFIGVSPFIQMHLFRCWCDDGTDEGDDDVYTYITLLLMSSPSLALSLCQTFLSLQARHYHHHIVKTQTTTRYPDRKGELLIEMMGMVMMAWWVNTS